MDIAKIKPIKRTIEIKSPANGEPIGISVQLVGMSDPEMSVARRQRQDAQNRLERNGRTPKTEDVEKINSDFLFRAMRGWEWRGDANFNGNKPEFNKAAVMEIFEELPWFRAQIDEELADDKAFFAE